MVFSIGHKVLFKSLYIIKIFHAYKLKDYKLSLAYLFLILMEKMCEGIHYFE